MMKKLYTLLFVFTMLLTFGSNAQTLYTNTVQTGFRFNPGLGTSGTPIIAFDDINIPSSVVGDADSIGFTKIKVGIRRLAAAPAVTVNVYLTGTDPLYPTFTFLDSFPAIPPTLIGSFNLPANGATATTQILSIGDSVNLIKSIAKDTGNLAVGFQTVFIGVSFSATDANSSNGWRLTSGPDANFDITWSYDADDAAQPRSAFSLTGATSTYYAEAFGRPIYAPLAVDAKVADITVPDKTSCYTGNQTVAIQLENTGTNPIAAGAATVKLEVTGANTYTATLPSSQIASGANGTITFNNVVIDNPGLNIYTASVVLASDGRPSNDTLRTGNFTGTTLSTFPATDDAEQFLDPVFTDAEIISGTANAWAYHNEDTALVLPNRAFDDSLHAHSGTGFYYFDAFNAPTGFSSRLYTNCIKLGATGNGGGACTSFLSFWLSADSSWADFGDDSLFVSVSTDKGLTWTREASYSTLDLSAGTAIWNEQIVDLSGYNGQTIQLGFEGKSGFRQAFGIDDLFIFSDCVVPVTFSSFTAQKQPGLNKLFWKTSQEINSLKYVVQHSKNGRDFTTIGEVAAAGNSTTERSYSFTHNQPTKGYNFYRLKIVDRDNKFKLSETRSLQNLGLNEVSSYPNPVKENLTVAINAEKSGVATIVISNVSGQILYNKTVNVAEGDNNINVNTGNLNNGNYILKVQMSDDVVIRKFNKL